METDTRNAPDRAGWRGWSVLHRIVLAWMAVGAVLLVLSLFVAGDFFANPACTDAFLLPTLIFSAVMLAGFISLIRFLVAGPNPRNARLQKLSPLVKYGCIPLLLAIVLCYVPVAGLAPMWLHRIFGEPYNNVYTVSESYRYTVRNIPCNAINIRELVEYDKAARICVSDEAFRALKPGDPIRLEGKRSWFGLNVEKSSSLNKPAIGKQP
jgi:hypothetical protein